MKAKHRLILLKVHKWIGLIGGIWIVVLGLTGLMLDHRDDWSWAWQVQVPDSWLPEDIATQLEMRHITLAQANPVDEREWVVGGASGLWVTQDEGSVWAKVVFDGRQSSPMVYGIVLNERLGWPFWWLATSDGLWSLDANAALATSKAFAGRAMTAIDQGAAPGLITLVEERSAIVVWSDQNESQQRYKTDAVSVERLPEQLSWSRLLFDLHLGRGLFDRPVSMLINDFGAIAFVLLPVTGFVYWFQGKRRRLHSASNPQRQQAMRRWIFRLHGPLLGLFGAMVILYLAATGIVMDHRDEWIPTLVRNKIDRDLLPPVYRFDSLTDEISHIVSYPGSPSKFTVGTRLGVLTTNDAGQSWVAEQGKPVTPGFVWSLRRFEDQLFLGGLGGPSFHRSIDQDTWQMIPGLFGMPSDATTTRDEVVVISGPSLLAGNLQVGLAEIPFSLPAMNTTPLMLLMFDLHSGELIHKHARYVLDLLALCTILMVLTGPILWWRQKW